ncbi:MAG: enoyl-CoA hydratase/isomerase family protein [Bacteroidetes bacterium]|nr:enoyl-CoA hydratase/isomerase family protein [Bacteroidota bacterium]MBU1678973.1 enoyl-CoA hydratase/isomerase family protein [Bacteroidota bacterium]MBU2507298.1 enoyl-CoA hydratase/isomerase family protein [Bacteroidota bacterium]
MTKGYVKSEQKKGYTEITFFHPKSNSLPLSLLNELASKITEADDAKSPSIILIKSEGESAFCAGASFEELVAIENYEQGKKFFMGFAAVILAMKNSSKFIITRVHGKVVGGGTGIVAASDYALASDSASVRLSELALSIGPFVIQPAVEKKIGKAAFAEMTIDHEWRSSEWAVNKGLYSSLCTSDNLDICLIKLVDKLTHCNPETIRELKKAFWEGTDGWEKILEQKAEINARLVLSDFTKNFIKNVINSR